MYGEEVHTQQYRHLSTFQDQFFGKVPNAGGLGKLIQLITRLQEPLVGFSHFEAGVASLSTDL